MSNLHHVYVTAHGEYTVGAWSGEKAQIGLRIGVELESSLPSKGALFTPYGGHGDVVADSGSQAGTNGTLAKAWTARIGPAGSEENADGPWQVDLCDDVYTFLNTIKGYQNNGFRWTGCKIAPILSTGRYGAPGAVYTFTAPIVGATSTSCTPPELAVAASLRAAVLGRKGRGRVYVPALSMNTINAADGTLAVSTQTGLRDALVTLVSNIENAPGTEIWTPLVIVTSAGATQAARPSQVRVGSHFDVQRRRQAQVPESYSTTAL